MPSLKPRILVLLVALATLTPLLAGCAQPDEEAGDEPDVADEPPADEPPADEAPADETPADAAPELAFGNATTALATCENAPVVPQQLDEGPEATACFEPTVAVDADGNVFVANAIGGLIARGTLEGGSAGGFERIAPPPLPEGGPNETLPLDGFVETDEQGRLYFTALLPGDDGIEGFWVARSDDAGESWAFSTFVSAEGTLPSEEAFVDRQWLAVGPGDVVYLVYMQTSKGIWVARSEDAGRSFDTFERIAPIGEFEGRKGLAGRPVVDDTGRLFIPYFVKPQQIGEEPGVVRVAVSEGDLGDFRLTTIHRPDEPVPAGVFMPVLARGANDAVHVAWMNAAGKLLVATSTDLGATWTGPEVWSPTDRVMSASPWVLPRDDRALVLGYLAERFGEPTTLVLQSGQVTANVTAERVAATLPHATDIPVLNASRPANTDFAHFVLTPQDQRVVATWAYPGEGILVTVEDAA